MRPTRLALIFAAAALAGCALIPLPMPDLEDEWSVHRIESSEISESSGLVKSRTHHAVFWTHNDSGDVPRIFAISQQGHVMGEFPVEGAEARDWEDIAIDDSGHLYIGDIGNNANERRDLAVYRVSEPDPARHASTRVDRVLRYRYADQEGFPEEGNSVFDSEAMFWMNGDLYLFTKHRTDSKTKLYRLPTSAYDGERALQPIAEFDVGGSPTLFGNTTAADISDDGRTVALLCYTRLILFDVRGSGDDLELREVRRIELDPSRTRQAESVAWDGRALIFGNEQRSIFRIPDPLAPGFHRYPPAG